MTLLRLENICAYYGQAEALHGITFEVEDHKTAAILGANGAGKTTLLRAISRAVVYTGNIIYQGKSLRNVTAHKLAHLGIAHVPEDRGTLTRLSVYDNLLVGAYSRDRHERRQVAKDIQTWFEIFPSLARLRNSDAGNLSGGEQQMLAICRALIAKPSLLMLDEPSLGLAPTVIADLYQHLGDLRQRYGFAMLLVEQNATIALQLADYVAVLESGEVIHQGDPRTFIDSDELVNAYMGTRKVELPQ